MTNAPFQVEVQLLRRAGGGPIDADAVGAADQRRAMVVEAVTAQLGPIRSRSSLLASFAREASQTEPVRTAYAIRWLELGPGIVASRVARSRRLRCGPLRGRG